MEGAIKFPKGRISELDGTLNPVEDHLRVLKIYGNHRLMLNNLYNNFPKGNFFI
ncbi:MAG: hypothetical protein MH321_06065 [Leptospiraceae bacterium]|nr:hypothetical protein [Leptospiraceae bacterium]